jgi:hypothetical protein
MATPGQVRRDPNLDGLGDVVASLVEDNLAEHPDRWGLVTGWAVRVEVLDAGSTFVILTAPGDLLVVPRTDEPATMTVRIDGDTLVGLPEIPLLAGLPDPRSAEGRTLIAQILRRDVRIQGLVRGLASLRRLLRLLNTAG